MGKSAVRSAFPYFVGLAVAAVLYFYTGRIEYSARPHMLGPEFWPRAAIALMVVACLFEIGRIFLGLKEARGVEDVLDADEGEEPVKTYPLLLAGGIVLVTVYAFVVDTIGFLLSTFLFLAAFMYLGRYRRHAMVWGISLLVTLAAALIFMRFAYVSLPRGEPPFDAITDFVRVMLGG
jgi:hypothetical protein